MPADTALIIALKGFLCRPISKRNDPLVNYYFHTLNSFSFQIYELISLIFFLKLIIIQYIFSVQYFVYGTVISFRYFYKYLVLNLLGESLRDVMRGVWIGYLVVISYQLRLLQHALKNISITINCSTSSCKYIYKFCK